MKYYDVYSAYGVHTIKVTIQCGEFIGSFEYEIEGDCKGRDLLGFDFAYFDPEDFVKLHKTNIDYDVDAEVITIWNKEHSNFTSIGYQPIELNYMIVAIELIKYRECALE